MLNAIHIENFKAFGERTEIPLAPITLILGENSAGKSSILQLLSLLKQTHDNPDARTPLLFRADRGYTDLGSYEESVHRHDLSRAIFAGFDFYTSKRERPFDKDWIKRVYSVGASFSWDRTTERVQLDWNEVANKESNETCTITRRVDGTYEIPIPEKVFAETHAWLQANRPYMDKLFGKIQDYIREHKEEIATGRDQKWPGWGEAMREQARKLRPGIDFWKGTYTVDQLAAVLGRTLRFNLAEENLTGWRNGQPLIPWFDFHYEDTFFHRAWTDEMLRDQVNGDANQKVPIYKCPFCAFRDEYSEGIDSMRVAVSNHLGAIRPLGPYRHAPERLYFRTGRVPSNVGYHGEYLPEYLVIHPKIQQDINHWLETMETGYQIVVENVGPKTRGIFELALIDNCRGDVRVSLPDVGFGVSQILPLITESVAAKDAILTIEQPEVHIHPRLQAEVGSLFAESYLENGNQFIVETHSEHLVLRMQRLVRSGRLAPDDVAILFVSRGDTGSTVRQLQLDGKGEFIDPWPGGFFPERMDEIMGG